MYVDNLFANLNFFDLEGKYLGKARRNSYYVTCFTFVEFHALYVGKTQ